MDVTKQKNYFPGIDLLKLLSIFLVLILHILGQGGVLNATKAPDENYWIAWLLEIFAYCAVNCFAMATGFLMANKKFKYRRIISLWVIVFFYTLLFLLAGNHHWEDSVTPLSWAFLTPVISSEYWYFTAYFFLFFFIPFLNKLVDILSRREYIILLLTGFLLFTGSRAFGTVNQDAFKTSGGYSAIWLIFMYLIGAGIKKHGFFTKIPAWAALLGYIGSVLATWGSQYGLYNWTINLQKDTALYLYVSKFGFKHFISYISPTIVCAGIFLMIFCLNLRLPKFLNYPLKWTAPLIFQVYIIHLHPIVWNNIIKKRFADYAALPAGEMVLSVIGMAVILLVQCMCIDIVRYWLFRLLHIDRLINFVADKITSSYNRRREKKANMACAQRADQASITENEQELISSEVKK